jgi:hypothetical protein
MERSIEPHQMSGLTAARATGRPEREPAGPFGRAVAWLDRLLRRRQRVYEFSDHPACFLRVAIVPAEEDLILADGTLIRSGEPIADLHIWNERMPPVPPQGAGFAWATETRRRFERSLSELAKHLETDPALRDVGGIRANTVFATRIGRMNVVYLGRRFGFERVPSKRRPGLARRLHDLGANLLLWALVRTFNRHALRGKPFIPLRDEYWMSRRVLLERYGRPELRG